MALKNYTSDQVVAQFGAIQLMTGRGEKVFLKITMMNPAFTSKVGADGETARSRSNDRRAKIEVTFLQTSDCNVQLSAVHQLDLLAPNGSGVAAFMVKDLNGTSLHAAAEAWITKAPDVEYSSEVTERTWEFEAAYLVDIVGGN